MQVIEGKFRVLSEDGVPVGPKRRMNPALRYWLTRPILWAWLAALIIVGLTEGLW